MNAKPSVRHYRAHPIAVKVLIVSGLSFLVGLIIPILLTAVLPRSDAGFTYIGIAASFVVNLACFAAVLALLPDERGGTGGERFSHVRAWIAAIHVAVWMHAGLWAAPGHGESASVFAALAFLMIAQSAAMLALHAALRVFWGLKNRVPQASCMLVLCALASALFWSREPIERLSKSGGNGAQYAAYFADGVMKLSPPMAVASTWHQESDSARQSQSTQASQAISAHRFDIVHGQLTYAVWIGSYQAVLCPDVLPSGGGTDFYNHRDFSPGIALILLVWALPLMVGCDALLFFARKK